MVLRKLSQTLMVSLAFMVATFSSGLLQPAVAYATPGNGNGNGNGPDPKVFVCKYVGTPGVNETLQTGTNPISVSSSSTGGTAVGSSFADAQGRSFVLSIDNTEPGPAGDPTVSACPAPQGPTIIPVPTVPTNDPCGPANITFSTVPTSANYTFIQNSTSVTFTTALGFVFTGGLAQVTVNLPTDSNVACPVEPTVIPVPTVPTSDPCGSNNVAFGTIPTSANYTHVVNGNGSITFTAATGFIFTGGLAQVTVNLPTDSNVACDVCPNIESTQASVPQGMMIDNQGNCVDKKIEICHATSAVVNPYNKIEVSVNAADGVAGNSGGQPDHFGEHTGAIFDPAVNENGDNWGDIIPPIAGVHGGLNWTTQGQAIYNNGDCVVEEEEPTPVADIDYALVCVEDGVKVTLTNSGDASGTATVNGTVHTVAANSVKEVVLDYDLGTPFITEVTVTIGQTTSTQTVNCTPGSGGETPVTPTTPGQTLGTTTSVAAAVLPAVLPATGGIDSPFMVIVASIIAYGAAYFLQGRRLIARKEAIQA